MIGLGRTELRRAGLHCVVKTSPGFTDVFINSINQACDQATAWLQEVSYNQDSSEVNQTAISVLTMARYEMPRSRAVNRPQPTFTEFKNYYIFLAYYFQRL